MPLNILIAQDENDIAEQYKMGFEDRGHKVKIVYNGVDEGIDEYRTAHQSLGTKNPLIYDAIIIDDIGYVQQEKEEMEVLFTLLAERYEQGSVMITSNLPFSKWENIFKDPMMTAAAVDRIVHHSVILELNIPSYRINTAKNRKLKEAS